jgi:hypothetical protein
MPGEKHESSKAETQGQELTGRGAVFIKKFTEQTQASKTKAGSDDLLHTPLTHRM